MRHELNYTHVCVVHVQILFACPFLHNMQSNQPTMSDNDSLILHIVIDIHTYIHAYSIIMLISCLFGLFYFDFIFCFFLLSLFLSVPKCLANDLMTSETIIERMFGMSATGMHSYTVR